MLLMVEKHFRTAPLNWRQRMAFWAAFLYYMASAALLVTGPLPTLVMVWFFPRLVHDYNYLATLPALLATLFVFPAMARGWRPTIYRVCTINSACHLLAVFHALRDRVEEWVPTGMSRGQQPAGLRVTDVAAKVSRILRTWIVLEQALLWGGLAVRVPEAGLRPYWAMVLLTTVQLYFLAPLLTRRMGLRERVRPRPPTVSTSPSPDHPQDMTVLMERFR